jgi:hypothetical protein
LWHIRHVEKAVIANEVGVGFVAPGDNFPRPGEFVVPVILVRVLHEEVEALHHWTIACPSAVSLLREQTEAVAEVDVLL